MQLYTQILLFWWQERGDSGSAPPGHLGAGLADPRRCPGDCGLPGVAPQQGQEGGQWVGQVRNQNKLMLTFLHFLSFILFVSAKKTCDLTTSYEKVKNIINYLQVHCVSVPMLYVVPRKISQVPKLQCIHHVCCQGRETSSTF